jgi:hypothetical protein
MRKSSKYTRSAKGQPCQVRVPGICNHDPETTVFAHLNGAGFGTKYEDIFGAYACYACHNWLDGGYASLDVSRNTRDLWHLQGVVRTQKIMIDEGIWVL